MGFLAKTLAILIIVSILMVFGWLTYALITFVLYWLVVIGYNIYKIFDDNIYWDDGKR